MHARYMRITSSHFLLSPALLYCAPAGRTTLQIWIIDYVVYYPCSNQHTHTHTHTHTHMRARTHTHMHTRTYACTHTHFWWDGGVSWSCTMSGQLVLYFVCSDLGADQVQSHKAWKRAIMLVWRQIAQHKYANLFLQPVRDDDATGYSEVVHR